MLSGRTSCRRIATGLGLMLLLLLPESAGAFRMHEGSDIAAEAAQQDLIAANTAPLDRIR